MAKNRRKTLIEPQPQYPFTYALMRVAVAQICKSAGFTSAKSTVLKTLTTVAANYLKSIGTLAASGAQHLGRSQSNLLDIVAALEDLHVVNGFKGASDVSRPLLKSSLLFDIVDFVDRVDEIPFAQRVRRSVVGNPRTGSGEVEARRGNIPVWLPPFPDPETYREAADEVDEVEKRLRVGSNGEVLWPYGSFEEVSVSGSDQERSDERQCERRELQADRFRVKFGFDMKRKNVLKIRANLFDDADCVASEIARDERDRSLKEEKKLKLKFYVRRVMSKNPEKRIDQLDQRRKISSLSG